LQLGNDGRRLADRLHCHVRQLEFLHVDKMTLTNDRQPLSCTSTLHTNTHAHMDYCNSLQQFKFRSVSAVRWLIRS